MATRAGGLGLADQVKTEFAAVYAERWPYLLAYKLRKVFTHESLSAISFNTRQREGDAMGTLHIRLDCSAIMDHLGPQVRAALNRQGSGLALDEVLEAAGQVFTRFIDASVRWFIRMLKATSWAFPIGGIISCSTKHPSL